jgi:hypothetical protein
VTAHFKREVGNVGSRLGAREALNGKGFPNLPNLPNLVSGLRVGVRTWACAHRPAHRHRPARPRACMCHFTLGRLGRLGNSSRRKAYRVPNLLPTFLTLGGAL